MNLLSLFSGCGGMDLGFEGNFTCLKKSINLLQHPDWISEDHGDWVTLQRTTFNTVFANDIRPDAKATWTTYFSSYKKDAAKIYHLGSIVDLVKQAQEDDRIFPTSVDVVTGGFPCQDFSIAGKRLGFNSHKNHLNTIHDVDEPTVENRGQLYVWMREVVTLTSPKIFIAENVKGLVNLDDTKEVIEHDFSQAGGGYLVVPARILNASHYGVPQSRERVIFMGFRKNALNKQALDALSSPIIPMAYDPYPQITHGLSSNNLLNPMVTCEDAFLGLEEPDRATDPSQQKYSKAKYMGSHCQGQTEIRLNSLGPTIRSEHHGNIEFRRLSLEHGGKLTHELKSGLCERRLTVRECARLQTFPDEYQFILPKTKDHIAVSASAAYKLIGNAIPCLLAYNIAKRLEDRWSLYFI